MPDPAKQKTAILLVDDHALFRESVARLLAAEPDFRVAAHCNSVEEGLDALRKTPVDIVLLDFDLGQRDGGEFMRLASQQGFCGKVLVVTAGVGEFVPFGAVSEEHFDKLFNINVRGALFTVQKALPLLKDGGSIILNGSVASVKGTTAFGVYAASKAAIRSLVRTWTTQGPSYPLKRC